ncbi:MAG TPA: glycosyltransferase [Candidatus Marinimicrobia bacterium]|nr:glycosyltransferase [Candidatus Neomarinimicrobiota bacterium]
MIKLTVLIPVFNEEGTLEELTKRLQELFIKERYDGKILFVNDGSSDGTPELLNWLAKQFENVKAIHFRFNKGKADALQAGFDAADGEFVITMDGDLQDDPAEIPHLLDKLNDGWDLVSGWKKTRHDPLGKTLPSKFFNKTTSALTGIKIHDFNCGLKAYRIEVVKSIQLYGELHRYIPVLAKQAGFRSTEIAVTHHPRTKGKSKYGFSRLFKGFYDLLTVLFITRFTSRPMHLFGALGLTAFSLGVFAELYLIVLKYAFGDPFRNHFAMLMLGILLILLGVQMFSIGLIGEMLVYFERRRRMERHE